MRPVILLNAAMTADGKIATKDDSLQISQKEDLIRVHKLRVKNDAIMVGINTVIIDDPKLTVQKIPSTKKDNPIRIIIDSKARTPLNSKVLNNDARTIILTSEKAPPERADALKKYADIITAGVDHVDLKKAMEILYDEYDIRSILLEGGSTVNFSMFKEHLIDRLYICIGSKILGGKESKTLVDGTGFDKNECINLKIKDIEKIDEDDILIKYDVIY